MKPSRGAKLERKEGMVMGDIRNIFVMFLRLWVFTFWLEIKVDFLIEMG